MGTVSLVGVLQADVRCACHIGKFLYTADTQGTVLEWNVQDASSQIFMSGLAAPVNALASVNKGTEMWAGLANGNITNMRLLSKSFGNEIVHAHDAAVNCIAEGSSCVWSGGDDFLIKKWDLQGVALFAYNHHHGSIRDLLIFRSKPEQTNFKLWGSSNDSTISIASVQDSRTQHELTSELRMLRGHTKAILVLCKVGVDSIWSGCEDGSIRVWSSLAFSFKKQLTVHKGPVVSLVVMGGNVWSGSGDHTVLVWDASICQPLFTLGDHGGYVKAMVRVEYMCWVFASRKNVKIWCAQSVWETSEQEKDCLNSEILKLKDDLDNCQRTKNSLGDVFKTAQESHADKLSAQETEVRRAQIQLTGAQKDGAVTGLLTGESERLKNEQAEKVEELERVLKMADESKRKLADENKLLVGKTNKLKTEIETVQNVAKKKQQDVDESLMQAQDDLRKSQDESKDMLKEKIINESLRITALDHLKDAEDEKRRLVHEVTQLKKSARRDKALADRAAEIIKSSHVVQLGKMAKRLQEMQNEVEQSHQKLCSQLQTKDDEAQQVKDELKKTAKDLKRALKNLEDEKMRPAKDIEDFRRTIEGLKTNEDALSASEAQNVRKLANLEKTLLQARNELQVAVDEKSRTLVRKDSDIQKLKNDVRDLRKAVQDAENERNKLQQSFRERERHLVGDHHNENHNRKQIDDLSTALNGLESVLGRMNELLRTATSERDEAGRNVQELKTQLKNLDEELGEARTTAGERTIALQHVSAENENLSEKLDIATAEKIQLEEDLRCLRAESARTASDQALARGKLKKLREDDSEKLERLHKDTELNLGDKKSADHASSHLKRETSTLENYLALATNQFEETINEKAVREGRAASTTKEFEKCEQRLAQAPHNLEQLRKQKGDTAYMAQEINQLKQERNVLDKGLAIAADKLKQLKTQDVDSVSSVDEFSQLKKKLAEVDDSLGCATQEIKQLRQEKSVQNNNRARIAGEFHWRKTDQTSVMRRLVHAVEESEQMKGRTSIQDEDLKYTGDEHSQLKRDKTMLVGNLASAIGKSYQVQMDRNLYNVSIARAAGERLNLKNERAVLKYRLAKIAEELELLLKANASTQADLARVSDELDQLKTTEGLLEGIVARETNGLEQFSEEKALLEVNLAQVAEGLEQQTRERESHEASAIHMADVNDHLRNEVAILENGLAAIQTIHKDMHKEIARLQLSLEEVQDECRLTRETARCDAANAAWRLIELLQKVVELEDSLNNQHPIRSVEDALWERVRELEMALLQAHVNYNSLSQDINWARKRRKSNAANAKTNGVHAKARKSMQMALHKFNKVTPEGMGTPGLGETVKIPIQPGFTMEYTYLKVSGCSNQKTIRRTVQVCPETPVTRTPQAVMPIDVPSTARGLVEPVLAPTPVRTEKERYFPSHGALRVRRGVGPVSPTREYHVK